MIKETKRIEAYSISEFAEKIQQGVLEGYRLDLESNENYPVQLGVVFIAGMLKEKDAVPVGKLVGELIKGKEVFEPSVLEAKVEVTSVQRGRPSKK